MIEGICREKWHAPCRLLRHIKEGSMMKKHVTEQAPLIGAEEWRTAAEEVLARAREVSRFAAERAGELARDTQPGAARAGDSKQYKLPR